MSIIDVAKQHPVAIGAGVIAVVVVAVVVTSGGGGQSTGTAVAAVDPNAASAGVQLQYMQAQLAAQREETAAKLALGTATLAEQYQEKLLEHQSTDLANTLSSDVALKGIENQTLLQKLGIEAQTKIGTLAAGNEAIRLKNEAAKNQAEQLTIRQQIAALLKSNQTLSQQNIALAQINAQPKGLFSAIFG